MNLDRIRQLKVYLSSIEDNEGVPTHDIGWLLLRCEDTLGYQGQIQKDSMVQLEKDIREFVEEFPNLLPNEIIGSITVS